MKKLFIGLIVGIIFSSTLDTFILPRVLDYHNTFEVVYFISNPFSWVETRIIRK